MEALEEQSGGAVEVEGEPAAPTEANAKDSRRLRARRWARTHPRAAWLLLALAVVAIVAAIFLWIYLRSFESTDDAQVDGHIAPVSTRIDGTALTVLVDDNQWVRAGQTLVELDPRDAQVALDRAEALLAQAEARLLAAHPQVPITTTSVETRVVSAVEDVDNARAALAASRRDQESAQARLREAEANATRDNADLERYTYLLRERAVPRERYDAKLADARAANATVDANRALVSAAAKNVEQQRNRLQQAEARRQEADRNAPQQVQVQRSTVSAGEAAVKEARAAVERARLDLTYTRVLAPIDGIVGRRSVQPGSRVQPGQELMAVVDVSGLWVTANYKETQLRRMQPGQRVSFRVDAFGSNYHGEVESIAGATGSRYSLLPPENATGNFVKVVQRVPVRIRIRPGQPQAERFRPGMSAVPKVWLQ